MSDSTIQLLEKSIACNKNLNSSKIKMTIFNCNENGDRKYPRSFYLNNRLETKSEIHFDIFRDVIEISFFNIEPSQKGIKLTRWEDITADLVDRDRLIEAIDKYNEFKK